MSLFDRLAGVVPETHPRHPLNLAPDERRARFAREFGEGEVLPRPPKSDDERRMDRRAMHGSEDRTGDVAPVVWPRL